MQSHISIHKILGYQVAAAATSHSRCPVRMLCIPLESTVHGQQDRNAQAAQRKRA